MEQQTPRTHPSFWRSTGGVATAIGIGAAAIGVAVALFEKSASATVPVNPGTFSMIQGHYYLFQLSSTSNPVPALQAVGFTQVQAEPDPINANNWIVSALWSGPGTSIAPSGNGWAINGAPSDNGAVPPPVPAQWFADDGSGTGTVSLTVGHWYLFSVRTSFLSGTPGAADAVARMLVDYGWGGAMVTAAADQSSSPDTWNVYAQWDGASVATTDAPPLWILIPRPFAPPGSIAQVLSHGPIDLGSTQPATPPNNTMP